MSLKIKHYEIKIKHNTIKTEHSACMLKLPRHTNKRHDTNKKMQVKCKENKNEHDAIKNKYNASKNKHE